MGYHLPWVAKNKKISSDMLCRWCEKENFLIFLVFTNLLWTLLFLHSPLLKEVYTKLIFFLTCEEIFKKKPFCCYDCLDLNQAQSFFPVFFTVLLSRKSVLKRSETLSLWPQTCTTFFFNFICTCIVPKITYLGSFR